MNATMFSSSAVLLVCCVAPAYLHAADPAGMQPRIITLEGGQPDPQSSFADLERRIDAIEKHLGIGRRDVSGGRPADRLSVVESESSDLSRRIDDVSRQLGDLRGRAAVSPAANRATTQGRLAILNWTGVSRYHSVNGTPFYVAPGRTDLVVPLQPVEAYLPGYELPRSFGMSYWRWTGQDYEMLLEIRNQGSAQLTSW